MLDGSTRITRGDDGTKSSEAPGKAGADITGAGLTTKKNPDGVRENIGCIGLTKTPFFNTV